MLSMNWRPKGLLCPMSNRKTFSDHLPTIQLFLILIFIEATTSLLYLFSGFETLSLSDEYLSWG
jgi:hypothetical protein